MQARALPCKGVSLTHYLRFPMFLNLKKGTASSVSQRFVKAPIAGPHWFLPPPPPCRPTSFKSCLTRHIYGGCCSKLSEFSMLNPGFNAWESVTSCKGGFPEASPHSSSGPCCDSTLASLSATLHIRAPHWAPLAAASTAGRDWKWLPHSLEKGN